MRALLVTRVFPPEPLSTAVAELAQALVEKGHEVTVLAPFPNRPEGRVFPGFRRSWRRQRQLGKVRVVHTWHSLSRASTLLSRLAENLTFGLTSSWEIARRQRPDVVYLVTWPLFAQWLNTKVLHWLKIPTVLIVQDLYPESYLPHPRGLRKGLADLAIALDAAVYRQCSLVAPLTRVMAEHIARTRRVPEGKLSVQTLWTDPSPFASPPTHFRSQRCLGEDEFVAMFAGSFSATAGLGVYLEAAAALRGVAIRIVLVGDGAERARLEQECHRRALSNVRILTPLPREEVAAAQAAADVLLVSLLPGQAEHTVPSKFISYLFSGLPVLASVADRSPTAEIIQEADCGLVVAPGDGVELARALTHLAALQPEERRKMGERAREYGHTHFSAGVRLRDTVELLEGLARS